jgi:hypothetical protein
LRGEPAENEYGLSLLKECLRVGIVPFLLGDGKKAFCCRGLPERENEKGGLTDTFLGGRRCSGFRILCR